MEANTKLKGLPYYTLPELCTVTTRTLNCRWLVLYHHAVHSLWLTEHCVWCNFFSREDFKALIREVRRSNKNTLSGLHLDAIAQQVKVLIDQRERKQQQRTAPGGGAKAAGKSSNKARPVEKKGGKVCL